MTTVKVLQVSHYSNHIFVESHGFGIHCKIGDVYISFNTMYYERALQDEANEKGASWLIAQINPEGINVYNYKTHLSNDKTVYEKELKMGDRDVLAMVIDSSDESEMGMYFVYDDILSSVWGSSEFLDDILADITFREVSLRTNKPLRDKPGRKGTKFSN